MGRRTERGGSVLRLSTRERTEKKKVMSKVILLLAAMLGNLAGNAMAENYIWLVHHRWS